MYTCLWNNLCVRHWFNVRYIVHYVYVTWCLSYSGESMSVSWWKRRTVASWSSVSSSRPGRRREWSRGGCRKRSWLPCNSRWVCELSATRIMTKSSIYMYVTACLPVLYIVMHAHSYQKSLPKSEKSLKKWKGTYCLYQCFQMHVQFIYCQPVYSDMPCFPGSSSAFFIYCTCMSVSVSMLLRKLLFWKQGLGIGAN